jgi:hypothetical protein
VNHGFKKPEDGERVGYIYLGGSQDATWRANEGYSLAFAGVCDEDWPRHGSRLRWSQWVFEAGDIHDPCNNPQVQCADRMLLGGAGALEASRVRFPVSLAPKLETLVKDVKR